MGKKRSPVPLAGGNRAADRLGASVRTEGCKDSRQSIEKQVGLRPSAEIIDLAALMRWCWLDCYLRKTAVRGLPPCARRSARSSTSSPLAIVCHPHGST